MARIAEAARVTVVAPEYRLLPEHPYPAPLEDALAVFEALNARGYAAENVVLAGDSAGGHLALSVQLALRDAGRPQAACAALISPWLDLSASRPSCRANDAYDYGQTSCRWAAPSASLTRVASSWSARRAEECGPSSTSPRT